ncbi:MAG: nuclear transport factor 2 family protein [Gammaproteobacteria bacterium]|nr:nuclear transport factor 2 family protein [Gammaproteobacteria bacterium]
MKITDPKNLNAHYNALFRAGDLEGLVGLYESSAILCPAPGRQLHGHEQIREQMRALLTLQGELVATQLSCVQHDGLAMLHATWSFKGTDKAGNAVDIGGYSSKLARKGADGAWRYIMDLPVALA